VIVMATLALDTPRMADRLQEAGFSPVQARAVTSIVNEASDPATRDLVTNKDLDIKLAPIRSDILLMKWMLGVLVALVIAICLKLFLV